MNRCLGLMIVLLLVPAAAGASQQGVIEMQRWRAMDVCAKQAQAAFPDFTADANQKRDARLQECLRGNNLPPRAPLPRAAPGG